MSYPNVDALADAIDNLTLEEAIEADSICPMSVRSLLEKFAAFVIEDYKHGDGDAVSIMMDELDKMLERRQH